jgi:hypothetical protein
MQLSERRERIVFSQTQVFCGSRKGEFAMHFCLTGQYTPQALSYILDNPKTNRQEAAKKSD